MGGWVTKITTEKFEWTFSIFSDVINFFGHGFHHPISPINSFENLKFSKLFDKGVISQIRDPAIAMGKFSKMLDEDTISQIRGSCDYDGGKLGNENCG